MKTCKKHGELEEVNIRTYIRNRRGRSEITTQCKLCHRETASTARNADRTKANEWARKDRKENPHKYRKYEANYINKHGIDKVRKCEVARIHGLTVDQYELLLNSQNNLCKICGKEESKLGRDGKTKRSLAVDHCHVCEGKGNYKIRGLLCGACNTAIGQFKDDPNLLLSAIKYLESHIHN